MPAGLIFLPVIDEIESDHVSTATLPAGALGLWQLDGEDSRVERAIHGTGSG